MRTLTRSRDRKLLGVAGGMAEYFDIDKSLARLIWVLVCVFMPPAVLAYFILGVVLPSAPPAAQETINMEPPREGETAWGSAQPSGAAQASGGRGYKRMARSRDRWLAGVAGGIAEYLDTDPIAIRAAFLVAFFVFGTGLLAYVVLAIVMPGPDRSVRP